MKKVIMFCAAALAIMAVACTPKDNIDWSKVTVNGFYVAGPATGSTDIKAECVMAAGFNEVDKALRDGMYEKYIVLEGGKNFYLVYNDGGNQTFYSADLKEFTTPEEEAYADNPASVLKGTLVIGDSPLAMKVAKTGLYHIVLDINKNNDLKEPQIVLLDASDFGVRGAMNGWGFTSADPKVEKFSNDGIAFTFKDQKMSKNGEFKFATGNYWKVTLDDAGKVKAEVSLAEGMTLNGANLKVGDAGLYTITLNFKLAAGSFDKNFSYTAECTEKSNLPETMFMIGEGIKGWNLKPDGDAVAMHPFHSQPGQFWAIRYIEAGKGFKFSTVNTDWGSDFTDLGNGTGFKVDGGNCSVEATGLYTLQVDYENSKVIVEPAVVVGMDAPFGNGSWNKDLESAQFTVQNGIASFTAVAAGNIRTFVKCTLNGDWWHAEFIPKDGKIVYREGGNDPEAVAITAGQVLSYNFNEDTATLR